ncbi:hypothetical protein BGX23_010459 [Mortierella sp. AD031]|nr:hypothetical protein BGX23_010459 [Mortierella sp. AD031]
MSTATSPVDTVYSGISSTTSFSSPSSHGSRGHPCTTLSELIIAEAHYLSTLKRVGNALNLASNQSLATGRKSSNVIRALVERWTTMMRIHIKFHDDVVATKEDIRGTTQLLNNLRSGHTPAEWDVALRHPFDHLTIYNEWLQSIDPHNQFNGPCLSQLNTLVLNVKTVIETNQNPRGMLKRLSTFARGVMKRPSSPQLSHSHSQDLGPTTPTTAISVSAKDITHVSDQKAVSNTRGASVDLSRATAAVVPGVTGSPSVNRIETVADRASSHLDSATTAVSSSTRFSDRPVSTTSPRPSAGTTKPAAAFRSRHPNRSSVARSDVSSVGSLTLAPSSESLHMKAAIAAGGAKRPTIERQASASSSQRQKFLEEREARKATLRMGAQAFIIAKTESLQQRSPTFVSRPSIDRLRTITKREAETKPPVKSLINFWEQATEPIEV